MDLRQRGHTLVESLVALGVLISLLGTAASGVGDLIHGARLRTHANDVLQQLMLARSEAIKRNTRVALCKSADGAMCVLGGGWEQGWILFQDTNNSGVREPHELLLERLPPLSPGWRLTANSPLARYVSYTPLGSAQLSSGAFQAGTFTVCRASVGGGEARQIIVNAGGRPRVQKTWVESCF